MISDINDVQEGSIECDICIVGAGAAGILLGLELQKSPLKIVILEGGGFEEERAAQALNDLDSPSLPIDKRSRVRAFGGTTKAWTGGWKPLDEEDFEAYDWIPLSGWPITKKDLAPFYDRAATHVGGPSLAKMEEVLVEWRKAKTVVALTASGALRETLLWVLPRRAWDFGVRFRSELERSTSVNIFLNAPVTQIRTDNAGVRDILVRTLHGKEVAVKADQYVLACGGIENARLLLASHIGNEWVGRCYMDHPKGTAGMFGADTSKTLESLFERASEDGTHVFGLQLSPEFRKKHHVPNSYVQLRPAYVPSGIASRIVRKLLRIQAPIRGVSVRNFMEQLPSPENRVVLGERRDALGNPLPVVHWQISEADKAGVRQLHEVLGKESNRAGVGVLTTPLSNAAGDWPISGDASHHMGTTRMGHDLRTSVVDANCRVHGASNLFIAGSSVFPTGGHANPTGTILALAVRLADYLKTLRV